MSLFSILQQIKWNKNPIPILIVGGQKAANTNTDFQCPNDKSGQYKDAKQCDKYYECDDGIATERLCPDGLVFDETIRLRNKCDQPFNVDCEDRTELRKFSDRTITIELRFSLNENSNVLLIFRMIRTTKGNQREMSTQKWFLCPSRSKRMQYFLQLHWRWRYRNCTLTLATF